jgi:hypothetical protein
MAITHSCDRCSKTSKGEVKPLVESEGGHTYELCSKCRVAFGRFMQNEECVGDYIYKSYDLPCPHHVPCIFPCSGSAYKLEKR